MKQRQLYKSFSISYISSLWAVSMIPGNLKVAGCFNFSNILAGVSNG